ncbi:MAG: tetratricopeptide repeat protein [Bacteroidia bacterium]|nr:tetratricopeptide repeat protein [Bacteroidia bacterium]
MPKKTNTRVSSTKKSSWFREIGKVKLGLFILGFLLYANTLTHDYVMDDAIVITDNMYTQEGFSGIPGILTKDTFFGFFKEEGKANLVQGGRYRPFTLIMFALEQAIFGDTPFIGHLINVLLYAFTGVLLYIILLRLMASQKTQVMKYLLPLLASLLFVTHPMHTEAVANIKGRDEIMALLGGLGALYYLLRAHDTKALKYTVMAVVAFFIGLMSKENTITFLAIIPLSFVYFTKSDLTKGMKYLGWLLIPTIVFLILRFSVLDVNFGAEPMELMNNPFVKINGNIYVPFSGGEKLATIIYTLGLYIKLLIFPHPLTHDYYPRHIDIMSFGDWQVILSAVVYIAIAFFAITGIKKKSIWSFTAIYFIATLSIVSNIVFPIGTNMSERFMYMPSVGFCLALAYAILLISQKIRNNNYDKLALISVVVIALGYGTKTFVRNFDWKTNDTLFLTDAEVSVNSAKLQNAVGGTLIAQASQLAEGSEKEAKLNKAVASLDRALAVHPNYKNAYLLRGNAHNNLKNFDIAILDYNQALRLDPDYQEAMNNLIITYKQAGRHFGETLGDINKAKQYLMQAVNLAPNDYETNRLLGVTYGVEGNHSLAIQYFRKASELQPNNAQAWANLSKAYFYVGDTQNQNETRSKALALDPNAFDN